MKDGIVRAGVRRLSREAAEGVAEGLGGQHHHIEPGFRAQRMVRGACEEIREQLGADGNGPLARTLRASAARVIESAFRASIKPIGVIASTIVAIGFLGAMFWKYRWTTRGGAAQR
jgi:hypothetical protein